MTSRSLSASECAVGISGTAKVGKTLTATATGCPTGTELHYLWYAGTKPISGADGATLKLKK